MVLQVLNALDMTAVSVCAGTTVSSTNTSGDNSNDDFRGEKGESCGIDGSTQLSARKNDGSCSTSTSSGNNSNHSFVKVTSREQDLLRFELRGPESTGIVDKNTPVVHRFDPFDTKAGTHQLVSSFWVGILSAVLDIVNKQQESEVATDKQSSNQNAKKTAAVPNDTTSDRIDGESIV